MSKTGTWCWSRKLLQTGMDAEAGSILDLIGANKGSGLYTSGKDIDATLDAVRNEWD